MKVEEIDLPDPKSNQLNLGAESLHNHSDRALVQPTERTALDLTCEESDVQEEKAKAAKKEAEAKDAEEKLTADKERMAAFIFKYKANMREHAAYYAKRYVTHELKEK